MVSVCVCGGGGGEKELLPCLFLARFDVILSAAISTRIRTHPLCLRLEKCHTEHEEVKKSILAP